MRHTTHTTSRSFRIPTFVLTLGALALSGLVLAGCTRPQLAPELALVGGLAELIEADSFSVAFTAEVDQLPLGTTALFQAFDPTAIEAHLNYDRRRSASNIGLDLTLSDNTDQMAEARVRLLDEQAQVELRQLPDLSDTQLQPLLGAAFFVPREQVADLTPAWQDFSSIERAAAAQVVRETTDLFVNIEELPEDTVAGATTRHFRAHLNPDAVNRLLAQLAALRGEAFRPLPLKGLDQLPLELWVHKRSGVLVKVASTFTDVADRTGSMEVMFSNINKRVRVEPLDDARPLTLEELIKVLEGSAGPAPDEQGATQTDVADDSPNVDSADDGPSDSSTQSGSESEDVPNTDTGDVTTPFVPEVPFPVQ